MEHQHLPGQVNFEYVMARIQNLNKSDERDYVHLMQLIYDGYQDMCLFHLNNLKVKWCDIDDNNIVPYPVDYLYYSKIAVLIGTQVHTLTKDDRIPLPRDYECGEESGSVSLVVNDSTITDTLPYTRYNMGYFADTGKNVGYYRCDEERRQFVLKGLFPDRKVILEYATVPVVLGEDTLIPRYVVDALIAYVQYKTVQYDLRVHRLEKEMRQQAYISELQKLRMIVNQMTVDEWMDITNMTKVQTPKR